MPARRGCANSGHTTTPDVLSASLPAGATGLLVALSGGADSCALLAAAALLGRERTDLPLRAVHIDHGLQPAAVSFRETCAAVCERLQVPLSVIAVEVAHSAGSSLEEAARDARYAALRGELKAGECLLTAHHALDQAETFLLQALRGAGPKGLASMPPCREFGLGWHVRPFLEVPRQELLKFGAALLESAEDPMNADLRFDRAYLRHKLWPNIEARWPGAQVALSRAARHAAEAQELLDETAALDLTRLRDGEALSVPTLRALAPPRRFNALRLWLRESGVEPPSTARLGEALRQVLEAKADHMPAIAWGTHALRRYRQRLFLTLADGVRFDGPLEWRIGCEQPLALGAGLGSLCWSRQKGGIDAKHQGAAISVRGRAGGETLKIAAGAKTHSLQHLCQEFGVLPWMRAALPLLFMGDSLIGVADLWLEARWCAADALGFAPAWIEAPTIS